MNLKLIWFGDIVIILILLVTSYPKIKKYMIHLKREK